MLLPEFMVLNRVFAPPEAQLDGPKCVRARFKHSSCRRCEDVCPAGLIRTAELGVSYTPAGCTGCGACTVVCPSAAFRLEGFRAATLIEKTRGTSEAFLVCSRFDGNHGQSIPCAGVLEPSVLLALFTMGLRRLRVFAGLCPACPSAKAFGLFQENAARASRLMAALGIEGEIVFQNELSDGVPVCSRRQFFGFLRSQLGVAIDAVLPDLQDSADQINLPERRRLLAAAARRAAFRKSQNGEPTGFLDTEDTGTLTLLAGDRCDLCGRCYALCPTGSLQMVQKDQEVTLVHYPAKCIGCRLCLDVCPRGSLIPVSEISVQSLVDFSLGQSLVRGMRIGCGRCGKSFTLGTRENVAAGSALCPSCIAEDEIEAGIFGGYN